MKSVTSIASISVTALLVTLTGCATQQGLESSNGDNVSSMSSQSKNTSNNRNANDRNKAQSVKAEPKKQTYFFSSNEIKELSTAFKSGSCDLTNLKKQSQKYDLADSWVKLYDRTPKPLSELNNQQKCLLAQSNDLYAYSDDFYDESQQSLNETWYKGNIPQDAKVATMRFMTPKALIPNCDSELGRPVLVDYEKDDNGNLVRTIIINEDFDYSCLKK